ncbi:MAG: hypothetical protein AAF984_04815 [Verrucomicrobiota bacterium]
MKYKNYLLILLLFLCSSGTILGQNPDMEDDGSGFNDPPANPTPPPSPPSSYLILPSQSVMDTIHSVAQEYISRMRNTLWMHAIIGDYDRQAADDLAETWEHSIFNANTLPTIYLIDPAVTYIEEDGQRVKDSDGYAYNPFDELYYDANGNAVTHANLSDVQLQGAYNYTDNIIYLSEDLFATGSDPLVARDVIIQELAHYLDFMLATGWGQEDHTGSEGVLASMCFDDTYRFFYDDTIDASRKYTDHATLFWPLNGGVDVELGFKKKLKRLKHKLRQEARDAAQEINHAGNALVRLGSEVLDVYEDAILEEYGEAVHLFDEAKDFYEAHSQAIQMAGMIAMLILSGPELVGSFGVGTPAVLAEDAMLLGAMEALTEAPEGVELAVMAADAVEDAYAIGDAAEMAEASVEAAQAAAEANAAYAEGASGIAELSGENIDFFLDTIEEFGDGDVDLISDHISMISEEADEIEEASNAAQSSYLAAEQNLDAAEAAEEAGTMTTEELEVVEDAVQDAADEAAEATSEAAEADAAEAEANSALAEENLDQFEDCGCEDVPLDSDPFASTVEPATGGFVALIETLRKMKKASIMSAARILGVMPAVGAPICTSQVAGAFLTHSYDSVNAALDEAIEADNDVASLSALTENNPSTTTLSELQGASRSVARSYLSVTEQATDLVSFAEAAGVNTAELDVALIDAANGAIDATLESVNAASSFIDQAAIEMGNMGANAGYDTLMSSVDTFSNLWDTLDESLTLVEDSQNMVDSLAELDYGMDFESIDASLSVAEDSAESFGETLRSSNILNNIASNLEDAADLADTNGNLPDFLVSASRQIVVRDIAAQGATDFTTLDSFTADMNNLLANSDNLTGFANTYSPNAMTAMLESAQESLNVASINPLYLPPAPAP